MREKTYNSQYRIGHVVITHTGPLLIVIYSIHTYIQLIVPISIPIPSFSPSLVSSAYLPSLPNFLSFYCDNPLSPISAASMWMCGHPPGHGQPMSYQWPLPPPEKKRGDNPHTISYPHPCFPAKRGTSWDPLSFMINFLTILILLSATRSDKQSTASTCHIHVTAKGRPFTVFSCPLSLNSFHPVSATFFGPWVEWYRYSTWLSTHAHVFLTFQTLWVSRLTTILCNTFLTKAENNTILWIET